MEENPREMELNFDGGSEERMEELEAFRNELSSVVSSDMENTSDSIVEAAETPAPAEEKKAVITGFSQDMEALMHPNRAVKSPAAAQSASSNHGTYSHMSAMEMAIAGKSYGTALRLLREQHNMSHKEIEQVTCIQPHYQIALENEDLSSLPPVVYVIAYIRTLCRFYKLSAETSNAMVRELKEHLEYSCNDELMNTLDIDRSGAAVNELRLKRFFMLVAGCLLGLIALIVLITVLFSSGCDDKTAATEAAANPAPAESGANSDGEVKFDPNSRYLLLEAPALELPKLPVAQ